MGTLFHTPAIKGWLAVTNFQSTGAQTCNQGPTHLSTFASAIELRLSQQRHGRRGATFGKRPLCNPGREGAAGCKPDRTVKAAARGQSDGRGVAEAEPAFVTTITTSQSNPSVSYITSITTVLQTFPWRKAIVWAAVFLTMMQMREFLGVIMGTFILSFIGNALVAAVERSFPERRRLVVIGMYSLIVAFVVGIGVVALPRVINEGSQIIYRIQQKENPYTLLSDKLREALGEGIADQLERFLLVAVSPSEARVLDISAANSSAQRNLALQKVINDYSGELVSFIATALAATSRFVLQCAVSLLFSFMIVWDLPAISRGVQSLRTSRLAVVYEEIAPAAATFGRLFGKALQAQSAIAIANTLLTALGMYFLNINGLAFLSVFVFFCSFVPVAGVFISTVPIGVVALTENGLWSLVMVVVMVVLTHAIEAYVLNPFIYSAHLKLHPLMVLAVLVFAEHFLGVWGLLVAVPLAVFFIEYVINRTPLVSDKASAHGSDTEVLPEEGNSGLAPQPVT